jgi:outer membrane lipoprotein SlyB
MTTLSQEELDGIYAFAVELGKRAGQMLTDAAQIRIDGGNATSEQKEHVQKENAVDLVTETDEGKLHLKVHPTCTHILLRTTPLVHDWLIDTFKNDIRTTRSRC